MIICNDAEIVKCDTKDTISGIIYPLLEMQQMIEEVNLSKRPILGEFDGSCNSSIILENVTHEVKNLRIENNRVLGDIKIFDTPQGKLLQNILFNEKFSKIIALFFRIRGSGIINEDLIISDYHLIAVDAVLRRKSINIKHI